MYPRPLASWWLSRSLTMPIMMSSPTRPPSSITFFAMRPRSVPSRTAALSMSPVEMWGTTKWRDKRTHCVPLPAPCRPSRMSRAPGIMPPTTRPSPDGAGSLQEALVVAQHQLTVDLTHELECDADGDQHGGTGKREVLHVEQRQDDVRRDGDHRHENRAWQRDAVDSLREVALGLRAGAHPGNEPALATDLVGLADRVEGDGVVEVRKGDD